MELEGSECLHYSLPLGCHENVRPQKQLHNKLLDHMSGRASNGEYNFPSNSLVKLDL